MYGQDAEFVIVVSIAFFTFLMFAMILEWVFELKWKRITIPILDIGTWKTEMMFRFTMTFSLARLRKRAKGVEIG